MKIGTLTFPGSPSHGASLQMYALYKVLQRLGVDAEVINYSPDGLIHNRNAEKDKHKSLIKLINLFFLKDPQKAFRQFEKQLNIYPPIPLKTTEELQKAGKRYECIVVGSDQVWNPVVTRNDMNFYLDFCKDDARKASYAASFGTDDVAEEDCEEIAKLLSKITYLSVREERGREIVRDLTGREVPVMIDPTFLIDGNDWRKLGKRSGAKEKYVFFYCIKKSPSLGRIAKEFAEKHGYRFVYISGGVHGVMDKFNPHRNPVFGVGPAEFIDLIDHAECVFTNSFHGTALSIILNKKFYVEYSSDTNSRLTNIIKTFQLEQCALNGDAFIERLPEIDYQKVNGIVSEKKKEAISFLKEIIG